MTKEEAKELLLHHSFTHEHYTHPKSERGFLGMLRPFQGTLIEENYHEIMTALKVLAEDLSKEQVDRDVISALWGICHLGRAWAIHPEGMLRSNHLIAAGQIEKMEHWIEEISYTMMCLLEGSSEEAFHNYNSLHN